MSTIDYPEKKASRSIRQQATVQPHILTRYYKFYRHNGASFSAAIVNELFWVLMWLFLRMESPFWQKIAQKQQQLFPHINPRRPKLCDPILITKYLAYLPLFDAHLGEKTDSIYCLY